MKKANVKEKDETTLNNVDKTRLAELVVFAVNPLNRFSINGKGEIYLNQTWLRRIFGSKANDYDFMEITKLIMDKLHEQKGKIPYVKQLCGGALGELIDSGNRSTVISDLYQAFLVTKQPESLRREGEKTEVTQQLITLHTKRRIMPAVYLGDRLYFETAEGIADLMNTYPNIAIVEDRR